MYNLRYHIASLIAVFLSLAVGLLLGTVVVERGVVSRQRTALVEGLREDFASIRADNTTLRRQNEQLGGFSDEAVATLVRARLQDRAIIVLADPTRGEAVARANEAIRAAGGTPVVVTFSDTELGLSDKRVAAAMAATLGVESTGALEAAVAKKLSQEWTTEDDPRALTKMLVDSGRLAMDDMPAEKGVSGAVVVGTAKGKADPALVRLGLAMRSARRPTVGVESTKRPTGVAAAAAEAGLSSVDDVDLPLGRLSLVWVLSGNAQGRFGIGSDADLAYPRPLFPE